MQAVEVFLTQPPPIPEYGGLFDEEKQEGHSDRRIDVLSSVVTKGSNDKTHMKPHSSLDIVRSDDIDFIKTIELLCDYNPVVKVFIPPSPIYWIHH